MVGQLHVHYIEKYYSVHYIHMYLCTEYTGAQCSRAVGYPSPEEFLAVGTTGVF